MKKILVLALLCSLCAFAGERISGGTVVFTNSYASTHLDSLSYSREAAESLICVIDQIEGSVLANKMTVFLPALTGQSDTVSVWLQELPSADANKRMETRNWENQSYVADNLAAPHSTGAYVYAAHRLGGHSYNSGASSMTWSCQDSLICPRVRISLRNEYAGSTVITGCDSLATSTMRINKLFVTE